MILPDPNQEQPIDEDLARDIMMAEAERIANGERIVLARLVRRVITSYLARTKSLPETEPRWFEGNGVLINRDGLIICGDTDDNGSRCIREEGHDDGFMHIYRNREIES